MNRLLVFKFAPLLFGGALWAGCDSENHEVSAGGTLVNVGVATTADCPAGGATIATGVDDNRNGVLDPT
ncbi:MAG TPA: hypothetical protein VGC42_11745, partial [Kofleriaceae bacterium]